MKAYSKHPLEFEIFLDRTDLSTLKDHTLAGTLNIEWKKKKCPFTIKKDQENSVIENLDKTGRTKNVELILSGKTYNSLRKTKSLGKHLYSGTQELPPYNVNIYIVENVLAQEQNLLSRERYKN
jgi:hypothetical protein